MLDVLLFCLPFGCLPPRRMRNAINSDVQCAQQHHEQVCQCVSECARVCAVCAVWRCSYAMLFHNYNLNTTVLYKNPLVNQCALAHCARLAINCQET